MGTVLKAHQRARSVVPAGDYDSSAHSIRVTTSQLCWIVALMIASCLRCPSLLGQTPASGNVQVGYDSWTFNEGAPADVKCLAQTNDGFLWLGGQNGLFRFDGTRFEPFSSPLGDRLLSTKMRTLFAPPSGGLCIGYRLRGFGFLNKGRVTNYAIDTGSVINFAQDRMELYGQAHPKVYGDSIIRAGNLLGPNGAFQPDSLGNLDLIQKGYSGLAWAMIPSRMTSST